MQTIDPMKMIELIKRRKTTELAAATFLAATVASQGSVVLSGDFVNGTEIIGGTSTPTLTITDDIVLNIPYNRVLKLLVFRNWVAASDLERTAAFDSPAQGLAMNNNGVDASPTINALYDNHAGSKNSIEATDGYILLDLGISVDAGTAVTIKAGSYTFYTEDSSFNPDLNGRVFTGEVFLADSSGWAISDFVTVPEPSVALLGLLGVGFFLRRRR